MKFLVFGATMLVAAVPATSAVIVNGSFEAPGGIVRDALATNYLPGWTYTSSASLDIYEDQSEDGLVAADGTHYVSFGHNGTYGGQIEQTIATVAGTTYTIHYSVAEQQGVDTTQVLRLVVNDGASAWAVNNSPLPDAFTPGGSLTFTAAGSSATVTFIDATSPGGGGPSNLALDAVYITGGAVPEPASWALMIGGFGVLGTALRVRGRRIVA